jgi:hypothetical protein
MDFGSTRFHSNPQTHSDSGFRSLVLRIKRVIQARIERYYAAIVESEPPDGNDGYSARLQ